MRDCGSARLVRAPSRSCVCVCVCVCVVRALRSRHTDGVGETLSVEWMAVAGPGRWSLDEESVRNGLNTKAG